MTSRDRVVAVRPKPVRRSMRRGHQSILGPRRHDNQPLPFTFVRGARAASPTDSAGALVGIGFVQHDPSRLVPTTLMTTLDRIQTLVARNEVRVSLHGSEELAADNVQVRDVIAGVATAVMVEDYPDYPKGRCCLVLQRDAANRPIHVVWGIPSGGQSPAVVVTAYRPDPLRWDQTWRRRRK